MLLDERLQTVALLVREGAVVADVGSDHGYLVCHLVASRKCPRAFATDINESPLKRTRVNIRAEGLGPRIETVLCDGLSEIPPEAVTDVVIAGMGGDLIADILLAWQGARDTEKHFVLQPMTKPEHLRARLLCEGFAILEEVPVLSGGHVYVVLSVRYTGVQEEPAPLFVHTGRLWEREPRDEALLAYMRRVHGHLCKKAEGLGKNGDCAEQALEYAALADKIAERFALGT